MKQIKPWSHTQTLQFARRQAVAILQSVQAAEDAWVRTETGRDANWPDAESHLCVAMEDAERLVQELTRRVVKDEENES